MAQPTIEQKQSLAGLIEMHGKPDEVILEKKESPAETAMMWTIWWGNPTTGKPRGLIAVQPDGKRGSFDNYA